MKARKEQKTYKIEVAAISTLIEALKDLDDASQKRVIKYVMNVLGVDTSEDSHSESETISHPQDDLASSPPPERQPIQSGAEVDEEAPEQQDGISAVGLKWLRRNKVSTARLAEIFSLGGDEIDLIADKVPGKSQAKRVRSVFLLRGIAAYLSSGAARFTYKQVRDACIHYDAFDNSNFSKHIQSIASEVSGSRDTGYSLTPRGLAAGAKLLSEMFGGIEAAES